MADEDTLQLVIQKYIKSVQLSRTANTARTYRNAMRTFNEVLEAHDIKADQAKLSSLQEDAIIWMADELKGLSPSTEQCYLTATVGLYEYIAGENLAPINLPRIRLLIKQRARRPGVRLPQFPKADIEMVLDYAASLNTKPYENEIERLINLRDRALLLTLADTGLRVHEACKLRRGDIDWHESRAIVIGKGNKEALVRFSKRAIEAVKDYLALRAGKDGTGGKALSALPIFARHDKASAGKVKHISTTTGREIVAARVVEACGEAAAGTITPHSFRHYFVTTVLMNSGNLKLAQELARHTNIAVTQRYTHLSDDELDKKYQEIFG
ncbi:MAG: tyrosine-type recombinase/integrase [Anaerolineaceae bacterium]|nr:tyrosine-type recombinase/integrase [Anaerolineaceae bacterium]